MPRSVSAPDPLFLPRCSPPGNGRSDKSLSPAHSFFHRKASPARSAPTRTLDLPSAHFQTIGWRHHSPWNSPGRGLPGNEVPSLHPSPPGWRHNRRAQNKPAAATPLESKALRRTTWPEIKQPPANIQPSFHTKPGSAGVSPASWLQTSTSAPNLERLGYSQIIPSG